MVFVVDVIIVFMIKVNALIRTSKWHIEVDLIKESSPKK